MSDAAVSHGHGPPGESAKRDFLQTVTGAASVRAAPFAWPLTHSIHPSPQALASPAVAIDPTRPDSALAGPNHARWNAAAGICLAPGRLPMSNSHSGRVRHGWAAAKATPHYALDTHSNLKIG